MNNSLKKVLKEMKKNRVLHFELSENVGGIEMFLSNLMSEIDREKFQFEFVTSAEHPALEERFLEMNGKIHHVPSAKNLGAYKKAVRELLADEFAVVHVHKNSAANIIPIVEAKKCGKKVVVHSHNTSPSVGGVAGVFHLLNKNKLNALADYKFACSTEAGKWLYTDENFEIVTNGIITEQFRFDVEKRKHVRSEFHIEEEQIVFGNIGRFSEQKNHMRLIRLFSKIRKQHPNSVMMIVGDGNLKNDIEREIKKYELDSSVILTGVRNDIPDLLMAMDAFVMPSLYEGLPIVGIEAQAAGLHLFLSDTISKETDIVGCTTWFSLHEADDELAKKIIDNDIGHDRTALNAKVVTAGYDIQKTAEKISNVYMELLK